MDTTPSQPLQFYVLDISPQQPGEAIAAVMDRIREAVAQLPQELPEPQHYFADGLYAREVTIRKGVMLVGKIHRTGHINVLLRGEIDIMTELGVTRYMAPAVLISRAGEQKIGHAVTDTTWVSIHATTETDLAKLEHDLVTTDLTARGLQ